jgi:hypothetical protein
MTEAEVVRWAVAGVQFIISVAEQLGHRDPVLEAMDALFRVARQKNREDLTAKHHPPR